MHTRWSKRAEEILDSLRDRWHERDQWSVHGGDRPGTVAAELATAALQREGAQVFVSAVHPSVHDETWDVTGPRFYVSIVAATMRDRRCTGADGLAPPPPPSLAQLLWPAESCTSACPADTRAAKRARPNPSPSAGPNLRPKSGSAEPAQVYRARVTEIGWTLMPVGSDPQHLHADIVAAYDDRRSPPRAALRHGRFHHVAWKPRPAGAGASACASGGNAAGTAPRPPEVSTEVVNGGFTEGQSDVSHYARLRSVRGSGGAEPVTAVVFDSEMLHRGAATHAGGGGGGWCSTLTVQICSAEGWPVLCSGGRCCKELLALTLPLRPPANAPVVAAAAAGMPGEGGSGDGGGGGGRCAEKGGAEDENCGKRVRAAVARALAVPAGGVGAMEGTREAEGHGAMSGAAASAGARAGATATPEADAGSSALRATGILRLPGGLPHAWRCWEVVRFVEAWHAAADGVVVAALGRALRSHNQNHNHKHKHKHKHKHGHAAAAAATAALRASGLPIAVYCPPPSQSSDARTGYAITGPRFYVSVTDAAFEHFEAAGAPPLPAGLRRVLWPGPDPGGARGGTGGRGCTAGPERARIRGLGWALAPPCSDPQQVHADIWGGEPAAAAGPVAAARHRPSACRFPHIMWKRGAGETGAQCTTEIVGAGAGGFARGAVRDEHYGALECARAPALIFNSELLHRGGATAAGDRWVSSCSVELCSAAGWDAWLRGTEGTTNDPLDASYRMLPVCNV
eukprot:g1332.t1